MTQKYNDEIYGSTRKLRFYIKYIISRCLEVASRSFMGCSIKSLNYTYVSMVLYPGIVTWGDCFQFPFYDITYLKGVDKPCNGVLCDLLIGTCQAL